MSVWSCLVTGLKHLQWFSLLGTGFWTVLPLAFNTAHYVYLQLVIQRLIVGSVLWFMSTGRIVLETGLLTMTPASLYLVSSKGAAFDLVFAKNLAPPYKPGLLAAIALTMLTEKFFKLYSNIVNFTVVSFSLMSVRVVVNFLYQLGMATVVGCLVATFNKECQAIAAGDVNKRLEAVHRFVFKFRSLKNGLQLCLLSVFTANTGLVIFNAYNLYARLNFNCIYGNDFPFQYIGFLVCILASNMLLLFYYAAAMGSCYQSFQGLAGVLR